MVKICAYFYRYIWTPIWSRACSSQRYEVLVHEQTHRQSDQVNLK